MRQRWTRVNTEQWSGRKHVKEEKRKGEREGGGQGGREGGREERGGNVRGKEKGKRKERGWGGLGVKSSRSHKGHAGGATCVVAVLVVSYTITDGMQKSKRP